MNMYVHINLWLIVGCMASFTYTAQKYDKVSMTPEELNGIGAAISLGIKLDLPSHLYFSGVDLADMVVYRCKHCHFTQLM